MEDKEKQKMKIKLLRIIYLLGFDRPESVFNDFYYNTDEKNKLKMMKLLN